MSDAMPAASESRDDTSQPGKRGGRCCSLSCAGCLVLLLLLGIGAWFAYARYGAPWLETRAAWLTSRIPSIGTLLELKNSLPLSGVTLEGGELGSRRSEDFPSDVWLPAGAENGLFNTGEVSALAALELPDGDSAQLATRIRSEMSAMGWERIPVHDPQEGVAVLFEKEGRRASYLVHPRGEVLKILVRVIGAHTPAGTGPAASEG